MKQIHFAKNILKLDGANASRIAKRVGRSPSTVRKWMRDGIPKSAEADCVKALKRAVSHQLSVVSQKGKSKSSDRKQITDNRKPKKSARIAQAPVRGKAQKQTSGIGLRQEKTASDVGHRQEKKSTPKPEVRRPKPSAVRPKPSAVRPKPEARRPKPSAVRPKPEARRPKPSAARSGRLPKPDVRRPAPTWEPGTFVPLTEREKNEQRHQKQLAEEEFERLSLLLNHVKALKLANDVRKSGVNGMRRVYRLHGKNKNQRQTLYDMIDNEDEAWVKFYEMCEEMGMSEPEIRSSWFSPK
jgi:hypothetical protein